MTAVLAPSDAFRNSMFTTHDDNQLDYSSPTVDWRARYLEVADLLADTRNELDDFHHSSKELEEELERELERAEKTQQNLKLKASNAEQERDNWKSKFMTLQTTHNTTITSLQRELDMLRQEQQKAKVLLRDLEMGNDDLERSERAISSSLVDTEAKYSRALEEKILLEHELLDKAGVEEECQRLKDELRDANEEITMLKEQASMNSGASATATSPAASTAPSAKQSLENLKGGLQLSELGQDSRKPTQSAHKQAKSSLEVPCRSQLGQSTTLRRTGFPSGSPRPLSSGTSSSPSGLARSNTTPALGKARTPLSRPTFGGSSPTRLNTITSNNVSNPRSKGVQMVSEMRARVKNLEQKIHTRVPRLRMGSVSGRPAAVAAETSSSTSGSSARASPTVNQFKAPLYSASSRTGSFDVDRPTARTITPASKRNSAMGDQSGWVLIMEDSPSPVKDKEKMRLARSRRRSPSPSRVPFRPQPSSTTGGGIARTAISARNLGLSSRAPSSLSVSTDRSTSAGTSSTLSSIPTPTSRPTTPTFLPVPSSGLYAPVPSRVSAAPSAFSASVKRSSLSTSAGGLLSPSGLRPPSATGMYRSISGTSDFNLDELTPTSYSSSTSTARMTARRDGGGDGGDLKKSRIGRPSSSRKSAGENELLDKSTMAKSRVRSGSGYGR